MLHYWWRTYFLADITQAFKSLNVFQVEGPVLVVGNVMNINERFLWWIKKDKTETSTMNLNKCSSALISLKQKIHKAF